MACRADALSWKTGPEEEQATPGGASLESCETTTFGHEPYEHAQSHKDPRSVRGCAGDECLVVYGRHSPYVTQATADENISKNIVSESWALVCDCNPSIQCTKAGGLQFKVSPSYIVRPCVKTSKQTKSMRSVLNMYRLFSGYSSLNNTV